MIMLLLLMMMISHRTETRRNLNFGGNVPLACVTGPIFEQNGQSQRHTCTLKFRIGDALLITL